MPSLKNHRHEKFARALAAGRSAAKAYVEAGYKKSRGNAATLKRQQSIQERVAELSSQRATNEEKANQKALAKAEVTAERIIGELACSANSDIGDIMDFTGDTFRLKKPRDIPEHARRAISSIKVKRYIEKDGEASETVELVEFKFWDKLAANRMLGQHFGLFIERHEVTFEQLDRILELATDLLRKQLPADKAKAAVIELVKLAKDSYGKKSGEGRAA